MIYIQKQNVNNTKNYDDEKAHEDDIKKSHKSASRSRRVYAAARVQRLSLSTLEYKIQGESEKKNAKTDATHT